MVWLNVKPTPRARVLIQNRYAPLRSGAREINTLPATREALRADPDPKAFGLITPASQLDLMGESLHLPQSLDPGPKP